MKRVQLIFLLSMFIVPAVFGQMKPPSHRDMISDLKKKLELTDEQVKKIEALFEKNKPQMGQPHAGGAPGQPGKMNEDMKKKMDTINNEIMKVLNEKQKEKFKKIIEDRKKDMGNMPPPPPDDNK
ncbi:MAG: hypothetical protein V1720_05850 [bacterium]